VIVGASSVVMKSVNADLIVAGNPARTVCARPMVEPGGPGSGAAG